MRHAKAVLTALIVIAAITSLCAQPEKTGRDKVVIGVIGPMATPEGQAEEKAVKLAVEEINAQGGILGYKVEVVVGTLNSTPTPQHLSSGGSQLLRRLT